MKTRRVAVILLLSFSTVSSSAQTVVGEWATQGYSARVRVAPCPTQVNRLCGTITWLWEPVDDHGVPVRDRRNPSVELRSRPLIGLPLLTDFRAEGETRWIDGNIYDPESGRTYKSSLTLKSDDTLAVSGCVLFVCRTQIWRRVLSICENIAK